jgi:predicted RNase H-like HicB family nuclease
MSECLIPIKIAPLEEGGFLATSDLLQGLIAQGRTIAETMEIAQDVARKLIESYLEHGDPLPPELDSAISDTTSLEVAIPVAVEI